MIIGDAHWAEEPGHGPRQRHVHGLTDRLALHRRVGKDTGNCYGQFFF